MIANRLAICVGVLGLSACVAADQVSVESSEPKELPKYFYDAAVALGFAEQIDENCRSLVVDRKAKKALTKEIEERAVSDGTAETFKDFDLEDDDLLAARLQDDAIKFVQKRKIIVVSRETWCAAGRAEISEKTAVGKLLREKG